MGGESYNDSIKEFGRVIEEQVDNKQSLFMRGNGNIDTDYYSVYRYLYFNKK